MPASSSQPDLDGSPLSEADRRALTRFLEQSLGHGFRLAIVEAGSFADREAILADVAALLGGGLLRVAVDRLPGAETNLWAALQEPFAVQESRCLALWGFEELAEPDWPSQLNVQRDLFVRDFAVPWLLFIHPASRVRLMQQAPDFCDFAILWVRDERRSVGPATAIVQIQDDLPVSAPVTDPLLWQARAALEAARYEEVRDLLSRFDLQQSHEILERVQRGLLGAYLERSLGHPATAEALVRDARNTLARLPASDEVDALERAAEAEFALVLGKSGRHSEAEVVLRRSLPVVEQAVGREDPEYAAVLHNLALALTNQGKYFEAGRLFAEALALEERVVGRDSVFYGASLHALARVLLAQGKYAEAERVLRDALGIKETAVGCEHPSYVASLHSLGEVLYARGEYAEAERVVGEVLAVEERIFGREHPNYGSALQGFAAILMKQGKLTEAERFLRASLPVLERSLGRMHPDYDVAIQNLAVCLMEQGRYSEAERFLRESLASVERTTGRAHPDYGESLHVLATCLLYQGKYGEAERLFREALAVCAAALGPDSPRLCPILNNLAEALAPQGRTGEGIRLLERALAIGLAALGAEHPDVLRVRNVLERLRQSRRRR